MSYFNPYISNYYINRTINPNPTLKYINMALYNIIFIGITLFESVTTNQIVVPSNDEIEKVI